MTFSEALEELKKGKAVKKGDTLFKLMLCESKNGSRYEVLPLYTDELLSNDWEIAP